MAAPCNRADSLPAPLAAAEDAQIALQLDALTRVVAALEAVQRVDVAKELRDRARAIEFYLAQRRDAGQAAVYAAEVRLRAERRLGELLPAKATKAEAGAQGGKVAGRGRDRQSNDATAYREDFSKQEASRLRLLASVPAPAFEAEIATMRRTGEVLTTARMLTVARSLEGKREHEERVEACRAREADMGPRCFVSFAELQAALDAGREQPFRAIYADPPWAYANQGTRGASDDEYTTAGAADIEAMPVAALAADDCFLFMWATSPLLPEGLAVMRAWGFTYKSSIVWDKDRIGLGNYARVQHELLLIGVKGKPRWVRRDVRSVVRGGAAEHSVKPDVFRALVTSVCAGPYVELFARVWSSGWASMGNEINGKAPEPDATGATQAALFAAGGA